MDLNTFNKKINQELKKLNRRQLVSFAWCCAVRTLPFLTTKGNFDYWTEKDRQKYIYSIFYALDINAYAYSSDAYAADAADARAARAAYAYAADGDAYAARAAYA